MSYSPGDPASFEGDPELQSRFNIPARFQLYGQASAFAASLDLNKQIAGSLRADIMSPREVHTLVWMMTNRNLALPEVGSDSMCMNTVMFHTVGRPGFDGKYHYGNTGSGTLQDHDIMTIELSLYRDGSPYMPEAAFKPSSNQENEIIPENWCMVILGREMPPTLIKGQDFDTYATVGRVPSIELGDEDCEAIFSLLLTSSPPVSVE